jgi:ankyrin repeat protein
VDVLLKFGAVINSIGESGRTALHIAAPKCHLVIVEFLLKFGAVVDSKDEHG